MKLSSDVRSLLDSTVMDELRTAGELTAYAVACRTERRLAAMSIAIDWRDVDRSLQRLRKNGAIATKRRGSFSYWSRTDAKP